MPRILIVLIAAAMTTMPVYAQIQPPDTLWTRTYGGINDDRGSRIIQYNNNEYIIIGFNKSTEPIGWGNVYLIKTNSNGDTIFTKMYGGGYDAYGNDIHKTSDGGFVITGGIYGVNPGYSMDVYLIRTDNEGNELWSRTYGKYLWDQGNCVRQTIDEGFLIAGWCVDSCSSSNIYFIKTDNNGDTIQTRICGNEYLDKAFNMCQSSDSTYVVVGTAQFDSTGSSYVYLIKVDLNGDSIWSRSYGGIHDDWGADVKRTIDGGYIITGNTRSFGAGRRDVYLIKTNSNGDTIWSKTYGADSQDYGYSVIETSDEGYLVSGISDSFSPYYDIYLIKTDSNSDTLWTKTIGRAGDDYGNSIIQSPDGGYIIAGYTFINSPANYDVYLIKLDSDSLSSINNKPYSLEYIIFTLHPPYPNPFNPATVIAFELRVSSDVTLSVFDIAGQEVARLAQGSFPAGAHRRAFDGAGLGSGIYFARLQAGDFTQTRKVVLVK